MAEGTDRVSQEISPSLPADVYLSEIVVPTVKEFLLARGDRRLAYLACISAFHVCDYLRRATAVPLSEIRTKIRTRCPASFDVVEGICNGSKHCGRDHGKFRHQPGTERDVPVFAYGVSGGWGVGRWGGIPGLAVTIDDDELLVDFCVQIFIASTVAEHPALLGHVDLAWIDDAVRKPAGPATDAINAMDEAIRKDRRNKASGHG